MVIAIENLAPVFPGPDALSFTPSVLRTMANRISSPALGLCLDVGHANVVADLRRADPMELIEPAFNHTVLFHLHDNFGARRGGTAPPELDPLRLDLHLPPGRGSIPWQTLAPRLADAPGAPAAGGAPPAPVAGRAARGRAGSARRSHGANPRLTTEREPASRRGARRPRTRGRGP